MHTPLVLASADIVGSDGIRYTRVAVRVLDGEAHVADRAGESLGSRQGVTSMTTASPGWNVTFADGTSWFVERAGCGCGGSV